MALRVKTYAEENARPNLSAVPAGLLHLLAVKVQGTFENP